MAGQGKNAKRPRKPRKSSGKARMFRAKRILRRLRMKIARWKKNQTDEGKKHVWIKDQHSHMRSRHHSWDTSGLEKHATLMESLIKKGKTRRSGNKCGKRRG